VTAGGATITDTGLTVTAGGITVTADGVKAAGGITVDNTGVTVTAGGATVTAGGVKAAGGITVDDTGVVVTAGGATITDTGLTVTAGGITVTADGVKAAGGITVDDSGVVVTAGGVTTTEVTSVGALGLNAAASNAVAFSIGGTEKARLHSDGNFGIGTSSPATKLDVNGGVQGTSAYAVNSDFRWKKGIKPLQSSLQKIMNLTGVSYQFRRDEFPDKNFLEGSQIGFIAQHVESTIPEIVLTDNQGWKSVQYSALLPVLVEAIKEQESTIREQENELSKLRKDMKEQHESQEIQLKELRESIHKLQAQLQ